MRYPDVLPPGYNICLSGAKLLVELDSVVYAIRKGFQIRSNLGGDVIMKLDALRQEKHEDVVEGNCALGSVERRAMFENLSPCVEVRVLGNGAMMETEYLTKDVRDDGRFDLEGLVADPNDPWKFTLQYQPVQDTPNPGRALEEK